MKRILALVLIVLVMTSSACAPRPNSPAPDTSDIASESPRATEKSKAVTDGMTRIRSNDGAYNVFYRTLPSSIPMNDTFSMELVIHSALGKLAETNRPVVTADAAMPHHGHGMNHRPTVTDRGDGAYLVQDMLFHMSGYWEIYIDITSQGITERAQWSVEIE
jgi:hypothetical protein